MQALSVIPKIEQLSVRVIRILGCNPGPMTLQGTNTYLIGTGKSRVLVDTGSSGFPDYTDNLNKVLREQKLKIQEIVLTHWHEDHVGGISDVYRKVTKDPEIKLSKFCRRSQEDTAPCQDLNYNFMDENYKLAVEGATLRIVYTPGHTDDHIGLWLEEEKAFFTGDCVLGEGTCVFEDLYDYMKSLDKILSYTPRLVYPGHGAVVKDPVTHINHYIQHRKQRETQILQVVRDNNDRALTAMDIVKVVYTDVPEHLHFAAANNVSLHLGKLVKDGKLETLEINNEVHWKYSQSQL